jgi:hypothetical protein
MFAQSLVEYGLVSRVAMAGEELVHSVQEFVVSIGPTTWLAVGITLVVLLRIWSYNRR